MSSYLQPDNTNVPFPFLLSEPSPGGTHFPVGRNGLSHPCLSSFSWSLWTHQGTSVLALSQTTVKQVTLTAIPSASQYPCRSWSKLSNVLEFWVYNFPGTSTILKYLNKVHCHPQGPPDQNGARILNVNNKSCRNNKHDYQWEKKNYSESSLHTPPHTQLKSPPKDFLKAFVHWPRFWKALLPLGFYPPSPVFPQPPGHSL